MNTITTLIPILSRILDLDDAEIAPNSYVIRDLKAESIDLLEIGVAIQHQFQIDVDDDIIFLKSLRVILARAERNGTAPCAALAASYPHLHKDRLDEVLADIPGGPVLQVRDLGAYIEAHATTSPADPMT